MGIELTIGVVLSVVLVFRLFRKLDRLEKEEVKRNLWVKELDNLEKEKAKPCDCIGDCAKEIINEEVLYCVDEKLKNND